MKKRLFIFLAFLLLGVALFVQAILRTGLEQIWLTLRGFSFLYFLIFISLSTLNFGLYTLRWKLILQRLHEKEPFHMHPEHVSFFNLFLHRMAGFALSYITPTAQTGGEPLRIVLLHEDGVPVSTATSSVIIDKGLEFAALFTFIAIGIILGLIDGSLPTGSKVFFGIILLFFILIIFWFYYSSIKNIGFFSSVLKALRLDKFTRIEQTIEKIQIVEKQMSSFYMENASLFVILIIISVFITGFLLLEHFLVARFLGVHLTFMQTFLVSTIPYIAYIVPIPGGLGLLESGTAVMFSALGVEINAFVLVFIIRIRDLSFVFLGLIHASKRGLKMLQEAFSEKKT
jgi:uncharacterized protein (TIRG00374 family)